MVNVVPTFHTYFFPFKTDKEEHQPSTIGGPRSLHTMPLCPQIAKWQPRTPKLDDGVWKGFDPLKLRFWERLVIPRGALSTPPTKRKKELCMIQSSLPEVRYL